MTLAKLIVHLGLDSDQFANGTKKAELSLKSLAKRAAAFGAGLAASFVGLQLGKKLLNVGKDFDALTDTIRVGTGATGAELKGLTDIALNLFKSIPTSMDQVGTALTQVQQITGATGVTLEDLTRTQLELARVTGTDLTTNIESTSKAFEQWGINVNDQSMYLDELFRVTQATGVPVATLAQELTQYGPVLRQMGFGFEESIALLGTLGKAGLDAGQVITGMRTAFKTFADSGVTDTNAALKDVFDRIKNAPSDIAAGQLAIDTFGSRAGPALADSIRGGRLEFDTLLEVVTNGSDTILGAAADTNDLAENWQIFKNRLSVAVLPVATKLFTFLNRVGIPALEKLIDFIETMSPNARLAALGFGLLLGLIGPAVSIVGALGTSITLLLGPIGLLIAASVLVGVAYKKNWLGFADGVKRFAKWLEGLDFKHGALGDLIDIFQDLAKGDVRGALKEFQHLIGEVGDAIADVLDAHGLTYFADVVRTTFHDLAQLVGDVVSLVTNLIRGNWRAAWNDFLAICRDVVKLAIDRLLMVPALMVDVFDAIPWGTIGALVLSGFASLVGWLLDEAGKLPGALAEVLVHGGTLLYVAGRTTLSWVWTGIASVWNWLLGQFSNLPGAMIAAITWSYTWFYSIGQWLLHGLAGGVLSVAADLANAVGDAVSGAIHRGKAILGIDSPSRVFAEMGRMSVAGFVQGVTRDADLAHRAVANALGLHAPGASGSVGTNASLGAMPAVSGVGGATIGGNRTFTFNVNGAADAEATARVIMRHIRRVEAGAH